MYIIFQQKQYLSDRRQFLDEELEDLWRQCLLQDLQQLLGLAAHGHSIAQVLHTTLNVTCTHGQAILNRRLRH
jgi:hypothetical protein